MTGKSSRHIPRSTSMSRLGSGLQHNRRGAPARSDVSQEPSVTQTSPLEGIADALRASSGSHSFRIPGNEHPPEELEQCLSHEGKEAQLLNEETHCKLLPPTEPSPLAVQLGLYSLTNKEACKEGLLVDSHISKGNLLLEDPRVTSLGTILKRYEGVESANFLDACFICKRRLGQGIDTYMYRGERAFCSTECRHRQILMDKQKDNCYMTNSKSHPTTHVRESTTPIA